MTIYSLRPDNLASLGNLGDDMSWKYFVWQASKKVNMLVVIACRGGIGSSSFLFDHVVHVSKIGDHYDMT